LCCINIKGAAVIGILKKINKIDIITAAAVFFGVIVTICCAVKVSSESSIDYQSEVVETNCEPTSAISEKDLLNIQTIDSPQSSRNESGFQELFSTAVDSVKEKSTKDNSTDSTVSERKSSDTDSASKSAAPKAKETEDTDKNDKISSSDMETANKSSDSDNVNSEISETKLKTKYPPKEYHFSMEHFYQMKDMPTGCEIVSTRAVLSYYGVELTYKDMLDHMSRAELKMTKDGKLYGKTPYQAYLGDPTKYSGFGCYPPVIMEMMENYNFDRLYAESTCNLPLDFLAKTYVTQDIPVLVWATIGMGNSSLTSTWYVEGDNGKPTKQKYTWRAAEHCLVLTGYDEKYYYFNDPMAVARVTKYEKSLAEKRYKETGCNSIIIREYN